VPCLQKAIQSFASFGQNLLGCVPPGTIANSAGGNSAAADWTVRSHRRRSAMALLARQKQEGWAVWGNEVLP